MIQLASAVFLAQPLAPTSQTLRHRRAQTHRFLATQQTRAHSPPRAPTNSLLFYLGISRADAPKGNCPWLAPSVRFNLDSTTRARPKAKAAHVVICEPLPAILVAYNFYLRSAVCLNLKQPEAHLNRYRRP